MYTLSTKVDISKNCQEKILSTKKILSTLLVKSETRQTDSKFSLLP